MLPIWIDSCYVEITRRCNMTCRHCMMGEQENSEMSIEVMRAIAQKLHINNITLGGGEPLLNVDLLFRAHNEMGNSYNDVEIISNGKEFTEKHVIALNKIFEGRDECYSALAISYDEFHEGYDEYENGYYTKVKQYLEDKILNEMCDINEEATNLLEYLKIKDSCNCTRLIICEGRAENNGIGMIPPPRCATPTCEKVGESWTIMESSLCINVYGDIMLGCNYSYESQEYEKFGNIMEDDIAEKIFAICEDITEP